MRICIATVKSNPAIQQTYSHTTATVERRAILANLKSLRPEGVQISGLVKRIIIKALCTTLFSSLGTSQAKKERANLTTD